MAHAQQAWSQASVRALVVACAIASVCVAGSPVHAVQTAKGRVALIVNKANTISEFSSADLRRILVGEITRWPGSSKITLLLLPPGSEERRAIVRTITGMSDDDFTRHWISLVFQGETTTGPKAASSPGSMMKLVAGIPSALGIVFLDDLPAGADGVKILRIDGKAPTDEGYPIVR